MNIELLTVEIPFSGIEALDILVTNGTIPETPESIAEKLTTEAVLAVLNGGIGLYAFEINSAGNLIITYDGLTAPDFEINEAGNLIFTF